VERNVNLAAVSLPVSYTGEHSGSLVRLANDLAGIPEREHDPFVRKEHLAGQLLFYSFLLGAFSRESSARLFRQQVESRIEHDQAGPKFEECFWQAANLMGVHYVRPGSGIPANRKLSPGDTYLCEIGAWISEACNRLAQTILAESRELIDLGLSSRCDASNWITVTEAANSFGLRTSDISKACHEDLIDFAGEGRQRRVDANSILRWNAARKQREKRT
jgi:hypothetical protein